MTEYGKPYMLEALEALVKLDMLESLSKHGNALWFGYHDETKCRWCQRYKGMKL